jgi:hypothetical protein
MQRPMTVPSSTPRAGNRVVVPPPSRGQAVPLVIMRHGLTAAGLDRQTRLGAVERLDLAFFIDRRHYGMGRRVDIKPHDIGELGGKAGIARALEGAQQVRLQFVRPPEALYRTD